MALMGLGWLLVLLVLLVHAHCDLRARDPVVEEGEGPGRRLATQPRTTQPPQQRDQDIDPARTGNWCPYVHMRMVPTPLRHGTEWFNMKHTSLCPSGMPGCRLVMSKPATRIVYRQGQKSVTSLLWHCCPGFTGENCEDRDTDPQTDTNSSPKTSKSVPGPESGPGSGPGPGPGRRPKPGPGRPELHPPGLLPLQYADPHQEQNDHQGPLSRQYDPSHSHQQHNTTNTHRHVARPHHFPQHGPSPHGHSHSHQQPVVDQVPYQDPPGAVPYQDPPGALPYQDPPTAVPYQVPSGAVPYQYPPGAPPYQDPHAALPVPHMMALVLSQLQPLLQGFNSSLERLSQQVGDLVRDVAQLKTGHPQMVGLRETRPDLGQDPEEDLEQDLTQDLEERWGARLDEVDQQIQAIQRHLQSQSADMEDRLHSQHAMLHYNLTSFKTDIDLKLKRQQKMMQVNLQVMNSTLTELKVEQSPGGLQEHPAPLPPVMSDTSALWDAVERLDNMVVNNSVKVVSLMEDMEVTSGSVQRLQRDIKDQERQLNQTARNSQIQFMETGLEVEAAKVAVLKRVAELAGNLSLQGQRLQENVEDMDYLYTALYKQTNVSTDCHCGGLSDVVARLEKSITNVTALANDNRLALEEDSKGEEGQWGGASNWEPAVEAVQQELQEVKESVASEQTKFRTMEDQVAQLSRSIQVQTTVSAGHQDQIKRLVASFNSLLKDAIRHSDVLELLLGEEVLEFLEWPVQDQEAHSIPVLKEQLRQQQEQLSGHEQSITSLLRPSPDTEEVPSADQPSSSSLSSHLPPDEWTPGGVSRSSLGGGPSRERQVVLPPEHRPFRADGSDLWTLEKMVEDLQLRVVHLEQRQLNTTSSSLYEGEAKLQAEVTWLKRGLEEHLRVFKNVFSNADVLLSSEETLELDQLLELVQRTDGRRSKKRGGAGGKRRSRREGSGVHPVQFGQSQQALMFMGGSPHVGPNGVLVFKGSLTQDQFQPGSFTIPVGGVYLFVLTLDLRPGHTHVVLRRSGGGAPVSLVLQEVKEAGPVTGMSIMLLRAGEELRLELRRGQGTESGNNMFIGLLLQQDT